MGPDGSLRVGAVDDAPVVLAGLAASLHTAHPDIRIVTVTRHVQELLASTEAVDLVLLDLELHDGTDPADNVARLTDRGWPVLIFTQDLRGRLVARAFRAGAAGVLSKGEDLDVVAEAVRTVAAGEPFLSREWAAVVADDSALSGPLLAPREVEAVRLYAAGMKLSSVARRLGVTDETVRTYLLRARRKYESAGRPAYTKTDLYIRAVEDGMLPPPGSPPAS